MSTGLILLLANSLTSLRIVIENIKSLYWIAGMVLAPSEL